ncbi:unnamed protein product [Effrenium voratum]|nr:unnamed protein product [Effrenium voratum]
MVFVLHPVVSPDSQGGFLALMPRRIFAHNQSIFSACSERCPSSKLCKKAMKALPLSCCFVHMKCLRIVQSCDQPRLRGLLLAVGIGSEAKAAGLAMDYRKLDQIDPSTRKLVGDVGSEKAQKAIGVITEAKQKMEALQTAYEKDVGVNFRPYLLPIPVMREALDVVYGLLDEESRRDAERVGRLLLSTRYLLNEAPTVKTEPSAARLEIELFRNAVEEQAKFRKEINELIRIMDKFLLFLS